MESVSNYDQLFIKIILTIFIDPIITLNLLPLPIFFFTLTCISGNASNCPVPLFLIDSNRL